MVVVYSDGPCIVSEMAKFLNKGTSGPKSKDVWGGGGRCGNSLPVVWPVGGAQSCVHISKIVTVFERLPARN